MQSIAFNPTTPSGYTLAFQGANASVSMSSYMGFTNLKEYNPSTCSAVCDQYKDCQSFNIYLERSPSVSPNDQMCPNPPSTTNIRCSFWATASSSQQATNTGQWRSNFQVVIAASNGLPPSRPPCMGKRANETYLAYNKGTTSSPNTAAASPDANSVWKAAATGNAVMGKVTTGSKAGYAMNVTMDGSDVALKMTEPITTDAGTQYVFSFNFLLADDGMGDCTLYGQPPNLNVAYYLLRYPAGSWQSGSLYFKGTGGDATAGFNISCGGVKGGQIAFDNIQYVKSTGATRGSG